MTKTVEIINEQTAVVEINGEHYVKKLIAPQDSEMLRRLIKFRHPNIASVSEIVIEGEYLFVLTEHIDGMSLDEYLSKYGSMTVEEAVPIIVDICAGLEALHSVGIIHRDVNPKNIIIQPNGRAVIIDYGISRTKKPSAHGDTVIMGTEGYAAPEQFGFRQTDERSDVYSLGCLINFMLCCSLPIEKITDSRLNFVIRRCTKIKPEERFESPSDVAEAVKITNNRINSKIKFSVKPQKFHRFLFTLWLFVAFGVSMGIELSYDFADIIERIVTTAFFLIGLFLPQSFAYYMNSKEHLFYYKHGKTKRILITVACMLICFIIAVILLGIIGKNWRN